MKHLKTIFNLLLFPLLFLMHYRLGRWRESKFFLLFIVTLTSSSLYAVELVNEQFTSNINGWSVSNSFYVKWVSNYNGSMLIDQDDWGKKTYNFGLAYANQPLTVAVQWCATDSWDSSTSSWSEKDFLEVSVNGATIISDSRAGCKTTSSTANADSNGDFEIKFLPNSDRPNEDAYIDWFTVTGTPVAVEEADLKVLEKASPTPNPVDIGAETTFQIRTQNRGPGTAEKDIILKVSYSQEVTISSVTSLDGFTCDRISGLLSAGSFITCTKTSDWTSIIDNKELTFVVQPSTAGTLTQTATIESAVTTDPDTSSNTSTSSVTVNAAPPTCQGCDCSLDTAANETSPGVVIPVLDGATTAVTKCISGIFDNAQEFYQFTVQSDGLLSMNGSSPDGNKNWVKLGSTEGGTEYYSNSAFGTVTQTATDIVLNQGDTVYVAVNKGLNGTPNAQYQLEFSFTLSPYIENADDLCYEDITSEGMICFDMGICSGGMGCKNTIPIKNDSNETLSNVSVIYDESSLSGSFGDNCGVDPSGSCESASNIDMGPVGMLGSTTNFTISSDIPPEESSNNAIWASNFMSIGCFGQESIYAKYTKDGQNYRGIMKPCGAIREPIFDAACGIFPSVLTSYEHLTLQHNSVIQSCYISYPEGEFSNGESGEPICYVDSDKSETCVDGDDDGSNGNCSYAPPPDNKFEHDFMATSDNTSTTNSDGSVSLTEYEYGNITFGRNSQNIHFDPQTTYSQSSRKLMVLGDIILNKNNQRLTFEAGDYYFRNLDFQRNGVIIQTKGDVKFFIENNFNYAGNGADVTDDTSSLFVYVGGDAAIRSTGGGNGWLGMFMYVEGDVTISSNSSSKFYGGITAEGEVRVTGNNFEFEYNADGAAQLGFPDCSCGIVQFEAEQYDISEDFDNPMPAKKSVHPVIELPGGPAQRDFNISYTTLDGSAIRGADYVSKTETVLIHRGESNLTLDIEIYNDPAIELDEYFFVQLYDPQPEGAACLNDRNKTKIMILAQTNAPICFNDDFETGVLDEKWRVLKSSGTFTPGIVSVNGDKRLRITPSARDIATAVTKDYEFDTTQNLIIVEFDYYAYGGCDNNGGGLGADGADGIVNVLFDSTVGDSPAPGGYGGSMGYAQYKNGIDGFEMGWLGLGIDEYGNFANCGEDREGGLPDTSCDINNPFPPQQHRNTVSIRGDGSEDSGYEFLQGVELEKMSPPQPKVAKKSGFGADGYYSGRYKLTVDARDSAHLWTRLERDMGSGYSNLINQFDAKDAIYGQGKTPQFIRYAITGGTGSGCNNHELSWIQMRGNCQVYSVEGVFKTGPFSAIDTFRWSEDHPTNVDDHAISTKIVGKPFELQISSMNEEYTASETKSNINIKYGIYGGTQSAPIVVETLRDANFTTTGTFSDEFTLLKAYKKVHVRIIYCGDYNATTGLTTLYPLETTGCWDPTKSEQEILGAIVEEQSASGLHLFFHTSDYFAVRPKEWEIKLANNNTGPFKAGGDVNITIKAKNEQGDGTPNFGETAGETFDIVVKENKELDGCVVGGFYDQNLTSGWSFDSERGIAVTEDNSTVPVTIHEYLTTKYNNVGSVNITITDEEDDRPCTKTFAAVDCNDKNITGKWNTKPQDTDSTMGPAIGKSTLNNVTWIPDHFDIVATLTNHNSTGDFTYLSDDLEMAAHLSLKIKAVTEENATTTNYNKACYANPLDLNISMVYTPDPINYPNTLRALRYKIEESETGYENDNNSTDIYSLELLNIAAADIFPSTDHNGSAEIVVKLNLDREFNETINPFDMSINDIRVTDDSDASNIITSDFNSTTISTHATYLYARVKSSLPLYDDVTEINKTTPLSIVLYCDRGLIECDTFNGINTSTGQTIEYDWYLAEAHANSVDGLDGNVSLKVVPAVANVASVAPADQKRVYFGWGVDTSNSGVGVTVTREVDAPLPLDVNITFGTMTSNWMIYNKNANSWAETDPFYRVRFIGASGWAGFGDTGHVVEGNISNYKNRKMSW